MTFTDFPFPPSVNQIYATIGRRRVATRELKQFKNEVNLWALKYRKELRELRTSLCEEIKQGKWIKIDLHLCLPFKKIWNLKGGVKIYDAANRVKASHDALSEVLGLDDKYFCVGITENVVTSGNPRVILTVSGSKILSDTEVLESVRTKVLHSSQHSSPSNGL